MFEEKITDDVHVLLKPYIEAGMTVCDLTVGNGYDTLFLAEATGSSGKVIGFDIQTQAIERTQALLQQCDYNHVELFQKTHSDILKMARIPFHIGMMNLGYLPGSDKTVVTEAATTLKAIENFLGLLESKGILSIVAYKGHDGSVEYEVIKNFLSALEPKRYKVRKISYVNRKNNVPVIFLIQKM
jgi:16S rRNA C1402 N4-methylase RsmH